MNTANNQLRQETERRMREGLLRFLAQEQEPTVSELCEAAQINRSTFYRHYRDIPDLMEQTEREIQKGLFHTVGSQGDFLEHLESSGDALEPLIFYIGQNRHFYRTYLRKHGDAALEDGYQLFWERKIQPMFLAYGVESEARMRYYFEYGMAPRSGTRRKSASGPSGSVTRNTKTRSAAPRLTSTRHR